MVAQIIPLRPQNADDAGEPSDITAAFRRYAPYVAAVAIRLLGQDHDIDDVVQDVFVHALRGQTTIREPEKFKAWLAVIAVRVSLRRLHRRRIARHLGLGRRWDPTWLMAPEATPEQHALLRQIYALLEDFPAAERVAWCLRYLQGERLEEVARLCGCSLATAKRRIAHVQAVMEEACHG